MIECIYKCFYVNFDFENKVDINLYLVILFLNDNLVKL